MLRFLLSTLLLLSSASPALARALRDCRYCGLRVGDAQQQYVPPVALPVAEPLPAADSSVLMLSVVYPGVVVLMTMTAFYFLRVMEPQVRHDHPSFIRSATALSLVWLIGFYPFLNSAIGGFLFCMTAIASTAGWFILRRFDLQARFWQKAVVFWSFFFFSLVAGVILTGYGPNIARFLENAWKSSFDATRFAGPFVLLLANVGALFWAWRIAGIGVPRPTDPITITRLKIYALGAAVVAADVVAKETHYSTLAWIATLLLALPSLAYYGVYWLVMRLPEAARGTVTLTLFVLLALFLMLLFCLSTNAPPSIMLLAASALGFAVFAMLGLVMLSQSRAHLFLSRAANTGAVFGAAALSLLWIIVKGIPQPARNEFIASALLPAVLRWQTAAALLPLVLGAICVILAPRVPLRVKLTIAGLAVSFLTLCYTGLGWVLPGMLGPW